MVCWERAIDSSITQPATVVAGQNAYRWLYETPASEGDFEIRIR